MNEKKKEPLPTTAVSLVPNGATNASLQFIVQKFRLADGKAIGFRSGSATVRLFHRAGQLAIWGKEDSESGLTITITNDGYDACNKFAGIPVKPTSLVAVPGNDSNGKPFGMQPNPYHIYDERGAYAGGIIRMVGIGRTVLGAPVIVDRTLHFNTNAYFLEGLAGVQKRNPLAVVSGVESKHPSETLADIIRSRNAENEEKAKDNPQKFGWLVRTNTTDAELNRAIAQAKSGTFEFFHTGPGKMGFWVNFGSAAVMALHSDFVRSQKFDSRKAETIAIRNVLRHHPLMPAYKRSPNELKDLLDDKKNLVDRYVDVQVLFCNAVESAEELDELFEEHDKKVREGAATSATDITGGDDPDLRKRDDTMPPPKEPETPEGEHSEQAENQEADERAKMLGELLSLEKAAGDDVVKAVLSRLPEMGEPKSRSAADTMTILAYSLQLKQAINKRDKAAKK